MIIRPEQEQDIAAVHGVNLAAFGQPEEAELVDRLRTTAHPFLSRVAIADGEVIGHILFTPVSTPVSTDGSIDEADGTTRIAGLAPMAVRPDHQRRGVGTALVRHGLEVCREKGFGAVVVLGHAEYYPRFGFEPASNWGLRFEADVPDEVFMAMELEPGSLGRSGGVVRYHPEFSAI